MKEKRIVWIDQLRSIAFLFVILGHVALPKEWQSLIYSFHMPLFFVISGMTLNRKKMLEISIIDYLKGQAQRLLVPYVWMQFLMFPMWYLAFHYITQSTKLTIAGAFLGIFIGNNEIIGAPSNALWFILVLFLANILFFILLRLSKGDERILFLLMLGSALVGYSEKAIPQIWHFNVSFTAVCFMYFGNFFMIWYKNEGKEWIDRIKMTSKFFLGAGLLGMGLISHKMNGRISMTANKFGKSFVLFYVTSLLFSALIILVVMYLPKMKLVTFIGQNTLLYVGIHIPILRVFEKTFPQLLVNYKYSIGFAFLLYIGIAPLCALANRFAPYICGKPLKKNTSFLKMVKVLLVMFSSLMPYLRVMKELGMWSHCGIMVGILFAVCMIFVFVCEKKAPFVFYQE